MKSIIYPPKALCNHEGPTLRPVCQGEARALLQGAESPADLPVFPRGAAEIPRAEGSSSPFEGLGI